MTTETESAKDYNDAKFKKQSVQKRKCIPEPKRGLKIYGGCFQHCNYYVKNVTKRTKRILLK